MSVRLLILLAGLLALVMACTPAATPTPTPTPTPLPTATPTPTPFPTPTPTPTPDTWKLVGEQTWQGKVVMRLWVNTSTLMPGQTLGVRVRVENVSSEPVEYTVWNIGDPHVYTRVGHPYGPAISLLAPGDPRIVMPAVSFHTLEPGQAIQREVEWNGSLELGGASIPAPNGEYTLEASFFTGRQQGDIMPIPLMVTHKVQMTGSASMIPADEAVQKAQAHASVKLWLEAHTGQAIAREEKGAYLVNFGGQWQPVTRENYDQVLNDTPTPNARLETGQWVVFWASKYGFPPDQVTVYVDSQTGVVTKVEPDLMAEIKGGVLATFDVQGMRFRVWVTNSETIQMLIGLSNGTSTANIPNGKILAGPGAGLHNLPWSWHLDPMEIAMAEMTIELCDGTPQYVEDHLQEWLDTVGRYCPWSANLADLEDYR